MKPKSLSTRRETTKQGEKRSPWKVLVGICSIWCQMWWASDSMKGQGKWEHFTPFPSYPKDAFSSFFCCVECQRYIRWLEILWDTSTKIRQWAELYKLILSSKDFNGTHCYSWLTIIFQIADVMQAVGLIRVIFSVTFNWILKSLLF